MTVSYSFAFSKNSWTTALKIIFRWKGSVWKSVFWELLIWLFFYYIVMLVYRGFLGPIGRENFELFQEHVNARIEWIPLNFLLGFFVSMVVDRWRQIFLNMGFIENVAHTVAIYVQGRDKKDTMFKRTLVRHMCLAQVLAFRDISIRVRKRFPNLDTVVKAGFMEEHEKLMYEDVRCDFNKYWIPISWACTICHSARLNETIISDSYENNIISEIKSYRTSLAQLCNFDWVPIPLAYPQLVMTAVRVYFILCLVARQFIIAGTNKNHVDLLIPLMTMMQFTFYVGWAKIAESHLSPMGEDDDHFECNVLIDRNIQTGLAIVDDTFDIAPALVPDRFGEDHLPLYTEETAPKDGSQYNKFAGSVAHIVLAEDNESVDMVAVAPMCEESEGMEDGVSQNDFVPAPRKTSMAARMGNIVKKKISGSGRPRRMSHFTTARVVPAAGPTSPTVTPNTRRTVRRASDWAMNLAAASSSKPFNFNSSAFLDLPACRDGLNVHHNLGVVAEEANSSESSRKSSGAEVLPAVHISAPHHPTIRIDGPSPSMSKKSNLSKKSIAEQNLDIDFPTLRTDSRVEWAEEPPKRSHDHSVSVEELRRKLQKLESEDDRDEDKDDQKKK